MVMNMVIERMWTEEFRPQTLDEVIGHEGIVSRLKEFARRGDIPHLLFAGPPGVGKTTCAEALINEIYGVGKAGRNVLRLNASDDRGINVIRNDIKTFASLLPDGGAKFKVILLDEADMMTSDAQHALRQIMERYSQTTRFILICNYSSKIIDPIQSRCALFRFRSIPKDVVIGRLQMIAETKRLTIEKKAFDALYEVSEGDMRRAINTLQAAAALGGEITEDVIYTVRSQAKPQELESIIKLCIGSKPSFSKARQLMRNVLMNYGLSGEDVVKQLNSTLINMPEEDIPPMVRVAAIDHLAEVDFRISEGCDPEIQLQGFLAHLILANSKYGKS